MNNEIYSDDNLWLRAISAVRANITGYKPCSAISIFERPGYRNWSITLIWVRILIPRLCVISWTTLKVRPDFPCLLVLPYQFSVLILHHMPFPFTELLLYRHSAFCCPDVIRLVRGLGNRIVSFFFSFISNWRKPYILLRVSLGNLPTNILICGRYYISFIFLLLCEILLPAILLGMLFLAQPRSSSSKYFQI